MKYIPGFIKRLIKMLIAGAFTFTVAACYGIMVDYKFLFEVRDPAGAPIPGISLELTQSGETIDSTFTDAAGFAILTSYSADYGDPDFIVNIEDIDDSGNGGPYAEQILPVTGDIEDGESEYPIIMNPPK